MTGIARQISIKVDAAEYKTFTLHPYGEKLRPRLQFSPYRPPSRQITYMNILSLSIEPYRDNILAGFKANSFKLGRKGFGGCPH